MKRTGRQASVEGRPAGAAAAGAPRPAPPRVLLVAPPGPRRSGLAASLTAAGVLVEETSGLVEAVDLLRTVAVGCAVLDEDLPGTTGHDALAVLRQLAPGASFVVTSRTNSPERERAVRQGRPLCYHLEPFPGDWLLQAILVGLGLAPASGLGQRRAPVVLVVSREPGPAQVWAAALRAANLEPRVAPSLPEATVAGRAERPDAVLLDACAGEPLAVLAWWRRLERDCRPRTTGLVLVADGRGGPAALAREVCHGGAGRVVARTCGAGQVALEVARSVRAGRSG